MASMKLQVLPLTEHNDNVLLFGTENTETVLHLYMIILFLRNTIIVAKPFNAGPGLTSKNQITSVYKI